MRPVLQVPHSAPEIDCVALSCCLQLGNGSRSIPSSGAVATLRSCANGSVFLIQVQHFRASTYWSAQFCRLYLKLSNVQLGIPSMVYF